MGGRRNFELVAATEDAVLYIHQDVSAQEFWLYALDTNSGEVRYVADLNTSSSIVQVEQLANGSLVLRAGHRRFTDSMWTTDGTPEGTQISMAALTLLISLRCQ